MKTVQEMIAVMQHFADGGKVEANSGGNWNAVEKPLWIWNSCDYRIAQPKKTQVKLLAWFDGKDLLWRSEESVSLDSWKRVPAEDKTIEVEG